MLVIEDHRAVRRSQLFALARSPVAEFTQHNAGWQQQQQKQQSFINCAHFWLVRETKRCALSGFICVLFKLDWYQAFRSEKIPLQAGLSPVLSYLQAPDNFFWNSFLVASVLFQQPPIVCLKRFYWSRSKLMNMAHLKISMGNLNLYFNGAVFISIFTFDKLCIVRH